jgi:hypothetical protein
VLLQPILPGFSRLTLLYFAANFITGVIAFAVSKRLTPCLPGWLWLPFVFALLFTNPWERRGYAMCLAVGLAIPCLKTSRSETWLPEKIAKYSYGIYLAHVPDPSTPGRLVVAAFGCAGDSVPCDREAVYGFRQAPS